MRSCAQNSLSACLQYAGTLKRWLNRADTEGTQYIDFFAGAGAMNYGHNNSYIKSAILEYLSEDHIIHALDMYTKAKEDFLSCFVNKILLPRNLHYKMMFCGSTGTNAVEAAQVMRADLNKMRNK